MTTDLQELSELRAPETKAELLERMAAAYEAAEAFIAAHDEAALTRPISDAGWSAKDYFAHLRDWEYSLVALLQKEVRYEAMGLTKELIASGDFDVQNDVLYQKHKDRPLADVLTDFRSTHQQLLDILANLNDEDLQRPYRHYQPNIAWIGATSDSYADNPVMGWMVGDTYGHYAEHILDLNDLLEGE